MVVSFTISLPQINKDIGNLHTCPEPGWSFPHRSANSRTNICNIAHQDLSLNPTPPWSTWSRPNMAVGSELSTTETFSLLSLSAACVAILANTFQGDGEPLVASLALSGLAFAASFSMIRWLGPTFLKAGIKGADLSKVQRREIPECMGAVCAIVYLLMIIVFIPFPFYKDIVVATSGGGNRDVVLHTEHVQEGRFLHRFPHNKVRTYLDLLLHNSGHAWLPIYSSLRLVLNLQTAGSSLLMNQNLTAPNC